MVDMPSRQPADAPLRHRPVMLAEVLAALGPRVELVSRRGNLPTPEAAAEQALSIVTLGSVTSHDGSTVKVKADTLCIHGDTPRAAEYARQVRRALEHADVKVAPLRPAG